MTLTDAQNPEPMIQESLPAIKRVLVVDDEPVDIMLAEIIISKTLGVEEVHKYTKPREALEFLENIPHPDKFPCLVLLDMKMPVINGKQFLEKMETLAHFNPSACRVILLSAYFGFSEGEEIKRIATAFPFVQQCIEKPFLTKHLAGMN